jgi:hypothetical protein
MIFSNTYINIGMMFGTTLANDDVAGFYNLAAEYFHTQSFAV